MIDKSIPTVVERNKILITRFLDENRISPSELIRQCKLMCTCSTCKNFVQHFDKDGNEVDFGHCTKSQQDHAKKPMNSACGYWDFE